MHEFSYHRPASIDEALRLLRDSGDASIVAGGMTLLPTMKMRLAQPEALVDLGGIDALRGIRERNGEIEIAAMTTHTDVAASAIVQRRLPALAALAARIGDPQVRNRGTIGGSVSNNDPAADYPAAVLALGARVVSDRREIAADDFFRGMFETILEHGEIVVALRFPVPVRAAYAKFANPASRYAIAGVMVAETPQGMRVAVTGAGPGVFRATEMEAALQREFSVASLDGIAIDAGRLNVDMHADQRYRAHLVGVMARRAVEAAGG
jgi:carbon-monoxide dehydrogenase medium subunit